jgi:hypothetical protein
MLRAQSTAISGDARPPDRPEQEMGVLEQLGVEITRAKRAKKTVAVMLATGPFQAGERHHGHPQGCHPVWKRAVRLDIAACA